MSVQDRQERHSVVRGYRKPKQVPVPAYVAKHRRVRRTLWDRLFRRNPDA